MGRQLELEEALAVIDELSAAEKAAADGEDGSATAAGAAGAVTVDESAVGAAVDEETRKYVEETNRVLGNLKQLTLRLGHLDSSRPASTTRSADPETQALESLLSVDAERISKLEERLQEILTMPTDAAVETAQSLPVVAANASASEKGVHQNETQDDIDKTKGLQR